MTLEFGPKGWFAFIISILLLTDITIILNIPFLRQIFGFLFLTFVPGLLVIQILKFKKLSTVELILYSVGLSVAFLMFFGLFINILYPLLGIPKPISLLPLIITINIIIMILGIFSYKIDKDFSTPISVNIKEILSPPALLLCLLPFLAIFGTYLVRFHHNNTLLMLMIVIIALIVILVAFDKFIPKKLYPLAIFMISITILYHRSLISPYLFGSDIYYEYYVYKLVELNSLWDSSAPISACNAMPSITILPAIYSSLLNMEGTWLFKIVYPLLFSFVPLGLYHIFQEQTDEKLAFLSTFFFMSAYIFFVLMLFLMRQQIAELFFVLLILLMIDKEMKPISRTVLTIIFGASLIVSHYGTAYIYMFAFLPFIWLSSSFMNRTKKTNLTGTFVVLYFTIALAWYIYLTKSVTFIAAVGIFDNIASNIGNMFSPLTSDPKITANFFGGRVSVLHSICRWFVNLTQFFIIVGVFKTILKRKEMSFNPEFFSGAIVSVSLIFACIAIPYVSSSLNMDRIYAILLLFLSPFCLLGGVTICETASKLVRHISLNKSACMKIVALTVLIPYFLFNTGFVYEIAGDAPASVPLSMERQKNSEDLAIRMNFYCSCVQEQTAYGIKWLSHSANKEVIIYCDEFVMPTLGYYGMIPWWHIHKLSNTTTIKKDACVYLGYLNVVDGIGRNWDGIFNITEVSPLFEKRNRIYANGGSEIYK
jgi:uncharacterized membrane protein